MPNRVVIDSGPLIALFDRDDSYHQKAVTFVKGFKGELVSNYAVVTEVTHLLDFSIDVQCDFLGWVMDGGLILMDIVREDLERIVHLTKKYADLPMDFADATLVVLCERLHIKEVASIDKDFGVYRTHDKKTFKNVFL